MHEHPVGQLGRLLPDNVILTVAEVAKALRVSEESVRRWADQWRDSGGQEGLPAFKVGKQWRFHRNDVSEHLFGQGRLR